MLRRVLTLVACGVVLSSPALAGTLLTFPSPTAGDIIYTSPSTVSGSGWLDRAARDPRPVALLGEADAALAQGWATEPLGAPRRLFDPSRPGFSGALHIYAPLGQSAVGILDGASVTDAVVAAGATTFAIDRETWIFLTAPEPDAPADLDRLALITNPPATDRQDRIWPVALNF